MKKEYKQLILIVVLSVTLYAVWPSSKPAVTECKAEAPNVRSVSLESRDRKSELDRTIVPPFIKRPDRGAVDLRQRWSIDEIIQNNPFQQTTINANRPMSATSDVQAIYFSSSAAGSSSASAVVGGRVVSQGQSLSPNQTVLEIRETGIAVGR